VTSDSVVILSPCSIFMKYKDDELIKSWTSRPHGTNEYDHNEIIQLVAKSIIGDRSYYYMYFSGMPSGETHAEVLIVSFLNPEDATAFMLGNSDILWRE